MREANRRRTSFNIIDTSIGFKCDLFVRKDRPFDVSAMSRRVAMSLAGSSRTAALCAFRRRM